MQFKVISLVFACAAAIDEAGIRNLLTPHWPDRADMNYAVAHNTALITPSEELKKISRWQPEEIYQALKAVREADGHGRIKLNSIEDESKDGPEKANDYVYGLNKALHELQRAHPHPEETSRVFFANLALHLRIGLVHEVCRDLFEYHPSMIWMCRR